MWGLSFEDQKFKKTAWGLKFSVLKYFFAGTFVAPFTLPILPTFPTLGGCNKNVS